jgi:hypothetical protein
VNAGYSAGARLNVAAVLEADADGDGYGDETQDRCPSDRSTQGPCRGGSGGGGGGGGGGGNASPTILGRPSAKPRVFRSGSGTTFSCSLSEAASVKIAIERRTIGRRVAGKCRKTRPGNRRLRRCKRYRRIGALSHQGKSGKNSKRFSGRLGGHRLRPGLYRAVLTAVDSAGGRSKAKIAYLRVLPRRQRPGVAFLPSGA